MKKRALSTVSSKFKRHNLNFDYDEAKNTIEIGRTKKVKRKVLKGVLLIVFAIVILLIIGSLDFPFKKIARYVVVVVPVAFALNEMWEFLLLAKWNKNLNLISPNEIIIETKEDTTSIKAESIKQIHVLINKIDADSERGALIFDLMNGQRISLFSLIGSRKSHLKEDLEYLRKVIIEHVGIDLK